PQGRNSARSEAFGHARPADRRARGGDPDRVPPRNREAASDSHPPVRARPPFGRRTRVYPRLRGSEDRIGAPDAPRAGSRIRASPDGPAHVVRARSPGGLPGDDRSASSRALGHTRMTPRVRSPFGEGPLVDPERALGPSS